MLELFLLFLILLLFVIFVFRRPRQKTSPAVPTFYKCAGENCVLASAAECPAASDLCFPDHTCGGKCNPAAPTFYKCAGGNCAAAPECVAAGGACFSDHTCGGNCNPTTPVFYKCAGENCAAASLEECPAASDSCFLDPNCNNKCSVTSISCDPLDISSSVCLGNTICDSTTKVCIPCDPSCAGKSCGDLNACGKFCLGCAAGQTCDLNSDPPVCKNNSYENINVRGGNIITPHLTMNVTNLGDAKCSPATCPPSLSGKCTDNGCEYDSSSGFTPLKMFNDSAGLPQVTITQYCELETGGCSGALGDPRNYISQIQNLIKNGQSIDMPISGTTVYAAGATNPVWNGNSALYTSPSYQGTSPYSGIVYEIGVQQSDGSMKYAIVAIVDRCAGYFIKGNSCNDNVAGALCSVPAAVTSCDYNTQNNTGIIEGGSCIYDTCNTSQVHSPCVGSNGNWASTLCKECSASALCTINKQAKYCDWCSSSNHPHLDLSLEAFNYLTSDDDAHNPRILSYIKPIRVHAPGEYNSLIGSGGCPLKNSYECSDNYSYKTRDVTCCCGYSYIFDPIKKLCVQK
jgi:hypothetical protein